MSKARHYFSLRCKGGNKWHSNSQKLKFPSCSATIGETADCDVRYDAGEFTPEIYASILCNSDGESWRIVRRSQYADISIDGKGTVGLAHQLSDGDTIRIGKQQLALQFQRHYDDKAYEPEHKSTPWLWVTMVAMLALVGFFMLRGGSENRITQADVEDLEESVYFVKVDSVQQIMVCGGNEKHMRPTKVLTDDAPIGTAFLTDNGCMITARHCVEYWIGNDFDLTTDVNILAENDIVRMAIETETFNHEHETDSLMQMRVFFSIYDFKGSRRYSFSSSDSCVHINRDYDGVFMLADFNKEYYWRTVRPYFENREMELGDILWISGLKEKGKIELFEGETPREIKRGTHIIICGFPMTGSNEKNNAFAEGTIMRDVDSYDKNIVFESNINHGFSGGPLLMKTNDGVKAIGIVSRVDSVSSGIYKWAVPTMAIGLKKGGERNE